MVALARKTLLHEWRRFLPAMLAVGFAGLLQLLQIALVLGIFGSTSLYITGSSADVWIGYPGTQSVGQGRSIDADVESRVLMGPTSSAWSRTCRWMATGADKEYRRGFRVCLRD